MESIEKSDQIAREMLQEIEAVTADLPTMTDMQRKLADEYLVDLDIQKACIRAGYAAGSVDSCRRMLKIPQVKAYLDYMMARASARSAVSAETQIAWLKHVRDADYTDAFDVNFELRSKDDIPIELRSLIQAITVIKKATKYGQDMTVKVTFADKMRAAEMISRYLGLFEAKDEGKGFTLILNQPIGIINTVSEETKPIDMGNIVIDAPADLLPDIPLHK